VDCVGQQGMQKRFDPPATNRCTRWQMIVQKRGISHPPSVDSFVAAAAAIRSSLRNGQGL
jgi:hypothetical protein